MLQLPIKLLQVAQVAAENPFSSWGEKLTVVASLGFFCWYFMKELKDQQNKHEVALKEARDSAEKIRQTYEEKIDRLMEKQAQITERAMTLINANTASMNQLSGVVEDLKDALRGKN